jgi:hypothetical protein
MIKISEVLKSMDLEQSAILRGMLTREGISEDLEAEVVPTIFSHRWNGPQTEKIAVAFFMGATNRETFGKFAPKLTQRQRCEVLALKILGHTREVMAKMYKVDRRTITHIYNPQSRHYHSVKEQLKMMGEKAFLAEYATPEVINRAMEQQEAVRPEFTGNNKFANARQGLHKVRGPNCSYDHRVYINWIEGGTENVEVSGWYYRDLDSDFPDGWYSAGGPDSLKSSQACYVAMLSDITDKLT